MKKLLAIVFLSLLWCNLSYAEISSVIKKNFTKACIPSAIQSGASKGVAKKYCVCLINYLNDNMTTAEYIELERKETKQPGSILKNSVIRSAEPYCLDKIG
jgi:hypothetical protein